MFTQNIPLLTPVVSKILSYPSLPPTLYVFIIEYIIFQERTHDIIDDHQTYGATFSKSFMVNYK